MGNLRGSEERLASIGCDASIVLGLMRKAYMLTIRIV
jgi:hypothetical protein